MSSFGNTLDDELFQSRPVRVRLTRQEKRTARQSYGLVRAKDRPTKADRNPVWQAVLPPEDLKRLQKSDDTLTVACEQAKSRDHLTQTFFWEDGLLYRKWRPNNSTEQSEDDCVQQLVLPHQCRQQVLSLAHAAPLAGHLGRKKTYNRVAQRFYGPRCIEMWLISARPCQRFRKHRVHRAPMIPLPVVEEPFK